MHDNDITLLQEAASFGQETMLKYALMVERARYSVFPQPFTREVAFGSHSCSLEACM
jgi:hypothetical protein